MTNLYEIQPLTLVRVQADVSRGSREMTWGDLGWKLGPKDPTLPKIKAALEQGEVFDLGGGVTVSTEGKVSQYHRG